MRPKNLTYSCGVSYVVDENGWVVKLHSITHDNQLETVEVGYAIRVKNYGLSQSML
jgi:hypothetical protein